MLSHFKKSASILTDQESQMVGNEWWPATICNTVIMNKVFNFQENESYNLRSGTHLASRNIQTTHFSTDNISSFGPKLWKLIPDKIKHASTLPAFKGNIKYWTINSCHCRLCKILLRILALLKFVWVSNRIHTDANCFFL